MEYLLRLWFWGAGVPPAAIASFADRQTCEQAGKEFTAAATSGRALCIARQKKGA